MYASLICLLFLFANIQNAISIKCYDCTSANNSMCHDPSLYDEETLRRYMPATDCRRGVHAVNNHGQHDFFCRKIIQTIMHKNYEPEVRVTRSCGWVRSRNPCYKFVNEDHEEISCQCFGDFCNSSSKLAESTTVVFTAFGALLSRIFWR